MPDPSVPLVVASARDLGPQFAQNPHRMIGQDGAYSIPCGSDTLWYFGDTLVGKRIPGESLWYPGGRAVGPYDMSGKGGIERMLNNTGLLLPHQDLRSGLSNFRYLCDDAGNLRTLIPLEGDEHPDKHRIWCLHGVCIDTRIILYFIKVTMVPDGPFPVNFRIVGSGLATGNTRDWTFRRVYRKGSSVLWGENEPHFATAVLPNGGDGWLYLYGARQDEAGNQAAYVARTRPESVDRPEAYEYLDSAMPTWNPTCTSAIPVFQDMPNELSVSFNAYLGRFLAVHSLGLSGDIVARTSPSPWGPWSAPYVLWSVRPVRQRPLPYPPLVYAGKEHPELSCENGRVVYITYVEFEEYFPHLVEVTFA